jgi:hypothetical protein
MGKLGRRSISSWREDGSTRGGDWSVVDDIDIPHSNLTALSIYPRVELGSIAFVDTFITVELG